ncbi:MAG: DNA repair ATPase [Psychrobium sp.]|nr:DNA repair ATPase [Psychrobium sp.]
MSETTNNSVDEAVAQGGSYDLIQRRLNGLGSELHSQLEQLNQQRIDNFGATEMQVNSRVRVRTEHNCVARDIAAIGDTLLFGYNVFLGLARNITVSDVFSLHQLKEVDGQFEITDQPQQGSFLDDDKFVTDFNELYAYYKKSFLTHVFRQGSKVFASFQIGDNVTDVRVFRWGIDANQQVTYIDNRGERDIKQADNFDFEWLRASREQQDHGAHPHYNLFDSVFIDNLNGTLSIKVENNTASGAAILEEPVDDDHQSLDDLQLHYAKVGDLILLKIKPYRENSFKCFIFNIKTQTVLRQDAIGLSCIQLPEDHGIIFPGGYYLQNGDNKSFDDSAENLQLHRIVKSPNGEDYLYIFYEPNEGQYALFSYNLITRTLQNPIYGHGQSLYLDGRAVIFNAESEPSRVHAMQIWQTPFCSEEHASNQPVDDSFFGKIGNPELVRGISDIYSVCKLITNQQPSLDHYNSLVTQATKLADKYFWLTDAHLTSLNELLKQVVITSELVLDEFEKVISIKAQSDKVLSEACDKFNLLNSELSSPNFDDAQEYVQALTDLTAFKGSLISHKALRYIDVDVIDDMERQIDQLTLDLSQATANYLQQEQAFLPYHDKISALEQNIEQAESASDLKPVIEHIVQLSDGLELLNRTMLSLDISDSRQRTKILEDISEIFSQVNRIKATADIAAKGVGAEEARAEFGARFKLLGQSVTSALNASDTPQECEQQLSSLLIQLEDLESQFSDYDEFQTEILEKRDEIYDNFEQHKQQLLDNVQRRCLNIMTAAERIIAGVNRRSQAFNDQDKLNSYFAADPMVSKLRQLVTQLRQLDDNVRADDIEAQLKNAKDQGVRSLRDKLDIFSADGSLVTIGHHQFSVNKTALELTLLPRDDNMLLHISGSEYFEDLDAELFKGTEYLWQRTLVSESDEVTRAEYLAAQILFDAQVQGPSKITELEHAITENKLLSVVQKFAQPLYQEGYDKGVHDSDAALILNELVTTAQRVGLLAYNDVERHMAIFYLITVLDETQRIDLANRCHNLSLMEQTFGVSNLRHQLSDELTQQLNVMGDQQDWLACDVSLAAEYIINELSDGTVRFVIQTSAQTLAEQLKQAISDKGLQQQLDKAISSCATTQQKYQLNHAWLQAFSTQQQGNDSTIATPTIEAALLMTFGQKIDFYPSDVSTNISVTDLLSQHKRITDRTLHLSYQEFVARLRRYCTVEVPEFKRYHQLKQQVLNEQKDRLNLAEFQPKALSSFVRNKLINDVYFPIIGANLAKQMGAAGENKRSDLMGMLLLISPPGYGKTTLIEYIASKLGLVFVKINCPSIGHDQLSLDPEQANNSTARREVEKINLAFEMGNNVMLYLDDIQHTNPEFLQKFISLCDGSRRIDGVWNGKSKTYDLRGKKFAIAMAGNPYTESGEAFKIPDMLANRADIYNLGDTLSGREYEFSLSFIENSLTSNQYLAPLATRPMNDVYRFVEMADGQQVALSELEHNYSQAEANEIIAVLKCVRHIQKTVLLANEQYIKSAAQDDKYRTEPPFKLQGSYRNMNKMAEKVVPVMTDNELEQLIADHYRGEAQTLTKGAEENLLKLGEIRQTLDEQQALRWQQIKQDYVRHQSLGNDDNPMLSIANQISMLQSGIAKIAGALNQDNCKSDTGEALNNLNDSIKALKLEVNVTPNNPANDSGASGHGELANALDSIGEQLRELFKPLSSALRTNKQIDVEMLNTLHLLSSSGGLSAEQQKHALNAYQEAAAALNQDLIEQCSEQSQPQDQDDNLN